ncbi:MAG: VCBS repeat-containing protein [Candidatus Omnitrophica bacterium]|nr:VCBS repeat-containing protein [Candidatus Omnitrophota bacterium]
MRKQFIVIITMVLFGLLISMSYSSNYLFADVNSDNKINILDLATVGKSFGSSSQNANWNANADVNKDDKVNILDLATVGKNFDEHYCLSKTYCLSEEDMKLSSEEQIRKFGFVVNDERMDSIFASSISAMGSSPGNPGRLPSQPGFPIKTGGRILSDPILVDLNKDGKLEVVVGSEDWSVYVWLSNGTPMKGWPQQTEGVISASPAAGDIDGDGDLEVVVGSWDGKVYVWDSNGTIMSGWPIQLIDWAWSSPTLADLDGDGTLEILMGSRGDGMVFAWHYNGTPVEGWPQDVHSWTVPAPLVVDINNDSYPEVITGADDGYLYGFTHDGKPLSGWPIGINGEVRGSPVAADIDNDGQLEIAVTNWLGRQLWVLNSDGTNVPGWPFQFGDFVGDLAIGDIDGDGLSELVVGDLSNNIYVLKKDGTLMPDWPYTTRGDVGFSAALADISGDGNIDVVIGSEDWWVYGLHNDARDIDYRPKVNYWWPFATGGSIGGSTAVGDMDLDGDIEVVFGSHDQYVYAISLPARYVRSKVEWSMFRHDPQHSGIYVKPPTFEDVPSEYWSFKEVEKIFKANITKGCRIDSGVLYYCPDRNVRRDEMAAFLQRALKLDISNPPATPTFSDVPKDYWDYAEIEAIKLANITKGCIADNLSTPENEAKFCPDKNVRRDEMAAFLSRALHLNTSNLLATPTFSDVPTNYWDYAEIEALYKAGITKGCVADNPNTTENEAKYCPANNVRRDEMAAFLARAFL